MDIYSSGKYKHDHPDWHDEDASWKSDEILKFIKKNQLKLQSILDIGCGTGSILTRLGKKLEVEQILGYEPSKDAREISSQINPTLKVVSQLPKKNFDLALAIDVIEHIEKPEELLKKMKGVAEYKIFHLPLALSLQARIRKTPLRYGRMVSGHLHEFTKQSALKLLENNGFEIIDFVYTAGTQLTPTKTSRSRFSNIFRCVFFPISPDLTSLVLGGYSLLVLAK